MVVFAAAAPQPVNVLLALGTAQLADEALGHHLVEALPVFPGDEDPREHDKGVVSRLCRRTRFQAALLGSSTPLGQALKRPAGCATD